NSQEAVFNLNMGDEPSPLPLYLRLTRSGDLWTFEHSLDGTMWMLDGMVTRSLVVSRVGVWAGNAGPAPTIT
ncbi:MAG: DUF1349 domain-containing protein, partial [Actinobacteria bacterium]|nr:DUF1349 domain-containing protein [Actinomycetota bacterium]